MLKERLLFNQIKKYIDSPEAIIVTGMRRVGKTSLIRFIYDKIDSDNKIFLDLENPLNQKYFEEENYETIKSTLEFLGLDFTKKSYLFLDEIQLLKKIPSVVKYLIDHYQIKCFLTGSATYYLKNFFTESLAGRKYIFELFPLNFKEFLLFKGSNIKLPDNLKTLNKSVFDTISNLYEEYLLFGGFPEVVLKKNADGKRRSLEDIFTSYFQLEVLRIGDFKRNNKIRDLILLLMQRVGSKLDIQKLSRELSISRPTLYQYISFLEDTYLIKTIKPFSKGKDIEVRKMPKVYICDCGLVNNFAKLDEGALFENNIFQNLRIKGEINYYQRKSGVEIDFILNKNTAIEVKINPSRQDLNKLLRITAELGIKESFIVSKKYSELENIQYGFYI
jgi:hypothetical protein